MMKTITAVLAAFVVATAASPLVARQDIDFDLVDDTPNPSTVSIPLEATSQSVSYDLAEATAEATASPLSVDASPTGAQKRGPAIAARAACDPQPTGSGQHPSPDTAEAFLGYGTFANVAFGAVTPSGYSNTFKNLHASSSAYGYMGMTTLSSYDPSQCAAYCDNIDGCFGINIFFERRPSLEPGTGCEDPPSTTAIVCVFWGGYVEAANAFNEGQYRDQFHVVIAGSNGYMKTAIPEVTGYEGEALGNAAINAPLDCNGEDTYMGSKIFTTSRFDAGLCESTPQNIPIHLAIAQKLTQLVGAAACESQNEYNIAHPPAVGDPAICAFFTTYLMAKNGSPEGQYCALYTQYWDTSYATNVVSLFLSSVLQSANMEIGTMARI